MTDTQTDPEVEDDTILMMPVEDQDDEDGMEDDVGEEEEGDVGEEEEEREEEIVAPPPKPKRRRRRKAAPKAAVSVNEPLALSTRKTDQSVADWLACFGGDDVRAVLKRDTPTVWDGIPIKGTICTYNELISEEEIQAQHGGGKYQLKVMVPRENGGYEYAGATTFMISGEPRVAGVTGRNKTDAVATPQQESGQAVVLGAMRDMTRDAMDRARESEKNSGTDMAMIQTLLAPMQAEVTALNARLVEKDRQLHELLSKPVDTKPQDRLYEIMGIKESSHGNTLSALREGHETEMRSVRDFHRDELRTRESRFERELEHVREASKREINTMETAHGQALTSQRLGFEMRIDGLKDTTKRLEREVDATKKELAELRGRKDLTPLDQIQSLVSLKSGLEALVPVPDGEPAKTGLERMAEVVMGSPLAEGIAARIAGSGMGGPQMYEQPPQPQDGAQLVNFEKPDGTIVQIPQHMVDRIQAEKQRRAEAAAGGEGQQELPEIDPADLAKAVTFIEAAIRNGTEPEIFARSARNMMPEAILLHLRHRGVDEFLNNMPQLQSGSPLTTVPGRVWVKKVAKFLIEGTTEGVTEPPPTSPVESQ